MKNTLASAVVLLALSSCAGEPSVLREGQAEGAWELRSGTVEGKPLPMVPSHRITLRIDGETARGTSACNGYGARFDIEGTRVSFSEIQSSAMLCDPAIMASENAYVSALFEVNTAGREGEELVLSGSDATLRFRPVAPVPLDDLVGRRWILESLVEDQVIAPARGEEATLELKADGTVSGSTGCRSFTGTWVAEGDEIVLPTSQAKGGRCPDHHLADQDGHVFGVIGDGFVPVIEGDRLTLSDPGFLGLIYRAAS
ncbi:MAG: META domain-containing protein [Actinomycetota bacterium]